MIALRSIGATAFFVLHCGASVSALAESRNCDPALASNFESLNASDAAKYAILDLVTKDNYSEMRAALASQVPGYFDGNYDTFSQKRDTFKAEHKFSSDTASSRALVRSFIPAEGYEAYVKCLSQHATGLTVYFKDDDNSPVASAVVRYVGVPGTTLAVQADFIGAEEATSTTFPLPHDGTKTLTLKRKGDENIYVTLNANGLSDVAVSRGYDPRKSLVQAVKDGKSAEVIKAIGHGADINAADFAGNTPLMMAVDRKWTDVVTLLLNSGGVKVNAWTNQGLTAIYTAALGCDLSLVDALLAKGADPTIRVFSRPPAPRPNYNWLPLDAANYMFKQKGDANCGPVVERLSKQ